MKDAEREMPIPVAVWTQRIDDRAVFYPEDLLKTSYSPGNFLRTAFSVSAVAVSESVAFDVAAFVCFVEAALAVVVSVAFLWLESAFEAALR